MFTNVASYTLSHAGKEPVTVFCLYTTIHPSTLTEWERDGVENGGEKEKKEHNMEKSEIDWIASLSINIPSVHLGTFSGNYVVQVSD